MASYTSNPQILSTSSTVIEGLLQAIRSDPEVWVLGAIAVMAIGLPLILVLIVLIRKIAEDEGRPSRIVRVARVIQATVPAETVEEVIEPTCTCGKCEDCPRAKYRLMVLESPRSGCPMYPIRQEEFPACQGLLYGSYDDENWELTGGCVRLDNAIVATTHQLRDYPYFAVAKRTLSGGEDKVVSLSREDFAERTEVSDISMTVRLTEDTFSLIGMRKARCVAVPTSKLPATISAQTESGTVSSTGQLAVDPAIFGQIEFNGSTKGGFSGCAYMSGGALVGIHRCGGALGNCGVDAKFISSLLVSNEETTSFLMKVFRTRHGARWRYNAAADTYTVYDGYDYHTIDEDAFEQFREVAFGDEEQPGEERFNSREREEFLERTYREKDTIEFDTAREKRFRRYAETATIPGLKEHWRVKAEEAADNVKRKRRLFESDEGLKADQVVQLPRRIRAAVLGADPDYQDRPAEEIPEEERTEAKVVAQTSRQEKVLVLTEAVRELTEQIVALNTQAEAMPEAATPLEWKSLQETRAALVQANDELARQAKAHQAKLAEQAQELQAEIESVKSCGKAPSDETYRQLVGQKSSLDAELSMVKASITAVNKPASEAKKKPKKLSANEKRLARSADLKKICEATGTTPLDLLLMLKSADVLSTAGASMILKDAGYANTAVREENTGSHVEGNTTQTLRSPSASSNASTGTQKSSTCTQKLESSSSPGVSSTTASGTAKQKRSAKNPTSASSD